MRCLSAECKEALAGRVLRCRPLPRLTLGLTLTLTLVHSMLGSLEECL